MPTLKDSPADTREAVRLAVTALRTWTPRHVLAAAVAGAVVAAVIGVVTVLIPNDLFARDVPPTWWDYPVWIVTSALCGMLLVTYLRFGGPGSAAGAEGAGRASTTGSGDDPAEAKRDRRTSVFGLGGGFLAWFAVGCPVCNKIALLALGYTGAMTWFAPVQPFLALGALALTTVALIQRLKGQVACPVRVPSESEEAVQ